MDKSYSVYVHVNKTNNKRYFGLTSMNPKDRWKNGKGYQRSPHFRSAIEKYGWDNFEHIILKDNLSKEEASFWERYYISLYNTTDSRYGYNISRGGERGGHLQTDETKRKIGENGFHYGFLGKKHTEETKQKMSRSRMGHSVSDDARNKLRKSALKNKGRLFYCVELCCVFETLSAASEATGCPKSAIVMCCQGKQKQSKGFHWDYAD